MKLLFFGVLVLSAIANAQFGFRPFFRVLSMLFYPYFITISSRFYPDSIIILSQFYPNCIPIISYFFHYSLMFIQILSLYYLYLIPIFILLTQIFCKRTNFILWQFHPDFYADFCKTSHHLNIIQVLF